MEFSDEEVLLDVSKLVSGSSVNNTQEPEINHVLPQGETLADTDFFGIYSCD